MFTSYFLDQNALIEDGEHELANATTLNMATVGVVNGMVDLQTMALSFPAWANNNTYGLKTLPDEVIQQSLEAINDPEEGCFVQTDACRAAVAEKDPENIGANEEVNDICRNATSTCFKATIVAFNLYSPVRNDLQLGIRKAKAANEYLLWHAEPSL